MKVGHDLIPFPMNRATSRPSNPSLSHASHALAEFFAGVVLIEEEDGSLQPVARISEAMQLQASPLTDLLEATEFELAESETLIELDTQLESELPDRQPPPESQVLVSLAQLRQWYAAARSRAQHDRLGRIQALGILFKQTFGETHPADPKPFVGWSAEEMHWWLEECNPLVQERQVETFQTEFSFKTKTEA